MVENAMAGGSSAYMIPGGAVMMAPMQMYQMNPQPGAVAMGVPISSGQQVGGYRVETQPQERPPPPPQTASAYPAVNPPQTAATSQPPPAALGASALPQL